MFKIVSQKNGYYAVSKIEAGIVETVCSDNMSKVLLFKLKSSAVKALAEINDIPEYHQNKLAAMHKAIDLFQVVECSNDLRLIDRTHNEFSELKFFSDSF